MGTKCCSLLLEEIELALLVGQIIYSGRWMLSQHWLIYCYDEYLYLQQGLSGMSSTIAILNIQLNDVSLNFQFNWPDSDFHGTCFIRNSRSSITSAECVSKSKTILSIIFYSILWSMCLQLTRFSCDDRENVWFILLSSSNRKYESLTIVFFGLGHETMVCAVCLTMFVHRQNMWVQPKNCAHEILYIN